MPVSSVDSAASSTRLLDAAPREGVIVTNTDPNTLYVLFDSASATTSLYSAALATGDSIVLDNYSGEVNGIWAANGAGAALVTSF